MMFLSGSTSGEDLTERRAALPVADEYRLYCILFVTVWIPEVEPPRALDPEACSLRLVSRRR